MAKCPAITGKGEPCQGFVHPSKTYCPAHDPARTEARRKAASKAGRSRAGSELHGIKQTLIQLADDVMARRADRGNAAVAATLLATAIKAIEAEVKLRELEEARLKEASLRERETVLKEREVLEILPRLEQLEGLLAQKKENRWGA